MSVSDLGNLAKFMHTKRSFTQREALY